MPDNILAAGPATAIARVLIDSPLPQLDRLFDYRIPAHLAAIAQPGVRVRVPLRSIGRIADGFIIEVVTTGDYLGTLNDLEDVVSSARVLTPEVWMLARRLADRAAGTASDIIRLAVPKRQVRIEKLWLAASAGPAVADTDVSGPADAGPDVAATDIPAAAATRPFDASLAAIEPILVPDFDTARIAEAIAGGHRLAIDAIPRVVELPSSQFVGHWAVTMAASAVLALASGGSAILAVPDYRDQEQLIAALRAVLPAERIVHLDARQPNPDRYRALLTCLGQLPLVIVGNRSVIYAPAARLALIALWDEGDPLYSEPLSPYVHARDAALVRQEHQDAALFFVSHARSTEVERLVEVGWLTAVAARRPFQPKVLPTAQQHSDDRLAAQARIPSAAWREARSALEHGPVLVQVARPGYAPHLACTECSQTARCPHCEGPLRLKSARATPSCSWCGKLATDWKCPNCSGLKYRLIGQGTGRTAEDLGRAFPGVRIIIADGERPILSVGAEPALVIATRGAEPIAVGGYRAILLLDGEQMVARESLRIGEDCLRWWCNAIALAAPGATTVLVGVGGALASTLATWRRFEFVRSELDDRRTLRFPPAVRVATVTGTTEAVQRALSALTPSPHVDVLGPVEVVPGRQSPSVLNGLAAATGVRAIVRFDYAEGNAVAAALRAEVIRTATSRRKRAGSPAGRTAPPMLRLRFDDPLSFDSD